METDHSIKTLRVSKDGIPLKEDIVEITNVFDSKEDKAKVCTTLIRMVKNISGVIKLYTSVEKDPNIWKTKNIQLAISIPPLNVVKLIITG